MITCLLYIDLSTEIINTFLGGKGRRKANTSDFGKLNDQFWGGFGGSELMLMLMPYQLNSPAKMVVVC